MKLIKQTLIVVASLLLTCGIILVGCQLFNQEDSSPTSPDNTSQSTSYWGQTGREGGKMAIFVPQDRQSYFSVNVPANDRQKPAEGYAVWYSVYRTSDNKFHAYVVYFKALEEATVCIGILNGPPELAEGEYDLLEQVVISYANYGSEALIHRQGPLELYAFPRRWAGWDQPKGGARAPAPDDPPEGEVLYFFSEGKTGSTMENRCGSSDPKPTTTTSTTSTSTTTTSTTSTSTTSTSTTSTSTTSTSTTSTSTTTTSTTTTTLLACPPRWHWTVEKEDPVFIRLCDDETASGEGPFASEAYCSEGDDFTLITFGTDPGKTGVQVTLKVNSDQLFCYEWSASGGTWDRNPAEPNDPTDLMPGNTSTQTESYSVAIECICD